MREDFARAVASYDEAAVLAREVGARMAERLDIVRIAPKRFADIGCATGDGVRELQRRYPQALPLAIDFSWKTPSRRALLARRIDHAMIFVFIAGSYTPFALLSFEGWLPEVVLVCVWTGAALGLIVNVAWIDAPKWVTAPAYLLVGWVGIIAAPQLFSEVGIAGAVLIIVGGVLYSLGALTYATHWPNPFPRTFGYHEVFHLLVVVALAVQLAAVYLVAV